MASSRGFKVRRYYEGRTTSHQLDVDQIHALKRLSKRIHVNATTFIGDFTEASDPRLDISALMNKHFDVFLRFDGYGAFTLMFRAPAAHADATKPYHIGEDSHGVTSRIVGDDVVIRLARSESDAELSYWKEMPELWLDMIHPLHDDLVNGDMSVLYLGWRMVAETIGQFDKSQRPEPVPPPVPPRLANLDLGNLKAMPRSLAALDKMLRFHKWPVDQPDGWPQED
jgi:hypothetical protein